MIIPTYFLQIIFLSSADRKLKKKSIEFDKIRLIGLIRAADPWRNFIWQVMILFYEGELCSNPLTWISSQRWSGCRRERGWRYLWVITSTVSTAECNGWWSWLLPQKRKKFHCQIVTLMAPDGTWADFSSCIISSLTWELLSSTSNQTSGWLGGGGRHKYFISQSVFVCCQQSHNNSSPGWNSFCPILTSGVWP